MGKPNNSKALITALISLPVQPDKASATSLGAGAGVAATPDGCTRLGIAFQRASYHPAPPVVCN